MKQTILFATLILMNSFCFAQASPPNEMKLTRRGERTFVGDIPFILSMYDADGNLTGGLRGDFSNTIMDISSLPEQYPRTLTLGGQLNGAALDVTVGLGRKISGAVFTDAQGLVFSDNARQLNENGASIELQFNSPTGNNILLNDLVVLVKTRSGKILNTRIIDGVMLVVEGVPREVLDITVTARTYRTVWTGILFPIYRGAKVGLVIYSLNNVSVGTEMKDYINAALGGDTEKISAVIKDIPSFVYSRDNGGHTLLEWAADKGRKKLAEFLIAHNASVDAKDNDGYTPLISAADQGYKDIVELLLSNKADVNDKDNNGNTPFVHAVSQSHMDVVELLLSETININDRFVNGFTPLYTAVKNGKKDMVELLISKNADVNAKSIEDLTALMHAVNTGQRDIVELLLANKADVNAKDINGWTPLHYAVNNGNTDLAKLLLDSNADVNAKDNKGQTPLYIVIRYHPYNYKQDVVELLLNYNADVNVKCEYGTISPFQQVSQSGDKWLRKLFRDHGGHK